MRHNVDDDETEVPDGGSVKVRMNMMDSMQRRVAFDAYAHQPGYVRLTDAQATMRREARDAMIKRAENAWRSDARRKPPDDDDDDDELDNSRERRSTDAQAIADA